jgi:hypothetical protein
MLFKQQLRGIYPKTFYHFPNQFNQFIMPITNTTTAPPQARNRLKKWREEISLYQEEAQLFQRLLRRNAPKQDSSSRYNGLLERLCSFRQETLGSLQQALRSLETQTAHATLSGNGKSHMSLFTESLEQARHQMNSIKRDALRELNQQNLRMPIW